MIDSILELIDAVEQTLPDAVGTDDETIAALDEAYDIMTEIIQEIERANTELGIGCDDVIGIVKRAQDIYSDDPMTEPELRQVKNLLDDAKAELEKAQEYEGIFS